MEMTDEQREHLAHLGRVGWVQYSQSKTRASHKGFDRRVLDRLVEMNLVDTTSGHCGHVYRVHQPGVCRG